MTATFAKRVAAAVSQTRWPFGYNTPMTRRFQFSLRALLAAVLVGGGWLLASVRSERATGTLADLRADGVYVLRQCPDVADVERAVPVHRPRCRVVHVLDLHPVTLDDFAADLRDQDPSSTNAEIEAEYQAAMAQVAKVYLAQDRLLRWLAEFHAVRRVHFESMTDADQPFRLPGCELIAVPAEDADAYRRADPFNGDRMTFEGPANDAREAAIVRRLLAHGPVSVIVLGGGHDLADELQAAGDAEYLRVTVEGYRE